MSRRPLARGWWNSRPEPDASEQLIVTRSVSEELIVTRSVSEELIVTRSVSEEPRQFPADASGDHA